MDSDTINQVMDLLNQLVFNIPNFQGAVRLATPIVLAALTALISSRAGILNIAGEGLMTFGAWVSVVASIYLQDAWLGLLMGVLSGVVVAILFAQFTLKYRADIVITGIGITIFAYAMTTFLGVVLFNQRGVIYDTRIVPFEIIHIPVISSIPVIGPLLSGYSPVVYISWVLVVVTAVFLYRTPWGWHLQAVGENPDAASAMGINVFRVRYLALIASGVFAALAGVHLSLGHIGVFIERMTAGRGFIGIAVNLFGGEQPFGVLLGSLFFGLVDQIGNRMGGEEIMPPYIVEKFPHLVTLILLIFISLRSEWLQKQVSKRNQSKLAPAEKI